MSCLEHRAPVLIEREFLPGGYQQEGNRKNNICKCIKIPEQHYYIARNARLPEKTCLIGPFVKNFIYKKDNESDTDEKVGTTQQVAIVMSDHEIDLIDAEQDDKKGVEETKVGRKTCDIAQNEIFVDPAQEKQNEKPIKDGFL